MTVSTKTYNIIKQVLTLVVPFSTFLATLGSLYGYNTDLIVGTIAAVATFAGIVLQVLSTNYDKEQESSSDE